MKTKAFFYETMCGEVMRCMFAGINTWGSAQWVIINPGMRSVTQQQFKDEDGLTELSFELLCMEGEKARSMEVAKMLGYVLNDPCDTIDICLRRSLRQLEQLGVTWDDTPLMLVSFVITNDKSWSKRKGNFALIIREVSCGEETLVNIDGFENLEDVQSWKAAYLNTLKEAGIPVELKIEN
jgi:hypothetical protein